MDTNAAHILRTIDAAIYVFTSEDLSGQDNGLTLEMVQAMVQDALSLDRLESTVEYVERYCDVMDDPATEAITIAANIDAAASV